jgi:hypothetical protein
MVNSDRATSTDELGETAEEALIAADVEEAAVSKVRQFQPSEFFQCAGIPDSIGKRLVLGH